MALSDTVAALEANFATASTAISAAEAEISKLAAEVAANAGVDPALVARIQAVADGLAAQSSALQAAATAGG